MEVKTTEEALLRRRKCLFELHADVFKQQRQCRGKKGQRYRKQEFLLKLNLAWASLTPWLPSDNTRHNLTNLWIVPLKLKMLWAQRHLLVAWWPALFYYLEQFILYTNAYRLQVEHGHRSGEENVDIYGGFNLNVYNFKLKYYLIVVLINIHVGLLDCLFHFVLFFNVSDWFYTFPV